jgi:hypothetical protein
MDKLLSARQRRPSMAKRKKRRIGAFTRRLSLSDLDLRTNAGKFANSIKEGLDAQIGAPTAGQQILIKLVAVKVLRCEIMYDQVLSNPRGGVLQDRIENYFLAWSNSIRRDLEALGAGPRRPPFLLPFISSRVCIYVKCECSTMNAVQNGGYIAQNCGAVMARPTSGGQEPETR